MDFNFKTHRSRIEQFRSIRSPEERRRMTRHTLIVLAITILAFIALTA